jgi:hypothetical protein
LLCAKYGFTVVDRVRTPYEEELFLSARWRQMEGASPINITKKICGTIPGVVPVLKGIYSAIFGSRLFSSISVLKILPAWVDSGDRAISHAATRATPRPSM